MPRFDRLRELRANRLAVITIIAGANSSGWPGGGAATP